MSLLERIDSNVTIIVTLGLLVAGVAFAGYQYKEVHLPEFEEIVIQVNYQACINRCIETCRANGISSDRCNCSHCNVYRNNQIAAQ